jgi:signal transduction histidine kinase
MRGSPAPPCGRVEVQLQPLNRGLELSVTDDGGGFDAAQHRSRRSLGHASMRQRVYFLGGRIDIISRLGQGTTIRA